MSYSSETAVLATTEYSSEAGSTSSYGDVPQIEIEHACKLEQFPVVDVEAEEAELQHVAVLLKSLHCSQYEEAFRREFVTLADIPMMTTDEWRELGVAIGHRKRLGAAAAAALGWDAPYHHHSYQGSPPVTGGAPGDWDSASLHSMNSNNELSGSTSTISRPVRSKMSIGALTFAAKAMARMRRNSLTLHPKQPITTTSRPRSTSFAGGPTFGATTAGLEFADTVSGELSSDALTRSLSRVLRDGEAPDSCEAEFGTEDMQQLKRLFDVFDKDNSGQIDEDELFDALRYLGYCISFREFDKIAEDGINLEFSDFVSLVQSLCSTDPEARSHIRQVLDHMGEGGGGSSLTPLAQARSEALNNLFRKFDGDGSGNIDARELRGLLDTVGYLTDPESVEKLVEARDTDGDGLLDFRDFCGVVEAVCALEPTAWTTLCGVVNVPVPRSSPVVRQAGSEQYDMFISYRRKDGADLAGRIYAELTKRGLKIFYDRECLPAGGFLPALLQSIACSNAFVPLITPAYLDKDRMNAEVDYCRMECEHGIESNCVVIPVIQEGFAPECFQLADHMPRVVEGLFMNDVVNISNEYFTGGSMAKLYEKVIALRNH